LHRAFPKIFPTNGEFSQQIETLALAISAYCVETRLFPPKIKIGTASAIPIGIKAG